MINGITIVITGSNSGIGLETLKLLANSSNKILAVDLRTDRIAALNLKNVFPMVCDVSTKENVDEIRRVAPNIPLQIVERKEIIKEQRRKSVYYWAKKAFEALLFALVAYLFSLLS